MTEEVVYRIGCEDVATGEEDVKALLDILEEGLNQCKCGKGYTTEEVKKRLAEKIKKINKKYKKTLTNLK